MFILNSLVRAYYGGSKKRDIRSVHEVHSVQWHDKKLECSPRPISLFCMSSELAQCVSMTF